MIIELSILILTLNSKSYLRDCLDSIQKFPPATSYEIWVADNGSNDGTVEMLEEEYPEVQIIRNETNLGFTKPTNQLLNAARESFYCSSILILLIEDCFARTGYLKKNPQVGISIPRF